MPDDGKYEAAGVLLNCLAVITSMWAGPMSCPASRRAKSWQTGSPEADDGTGGEGDRNGNQNPEQGCE